MSSYRVNLLDVMRTQASTEQENKRNVLRVYGGLLAAVHGLDIAAAAALCVVYGDFQFRAAWRPLYDFDLAFGHEVTDVVLMALFRAVFFFAGK